MNKESKKWQSGKQGTFGDRLADLEERERRKTGQTGI
jgi:hypothetical protein